MKRFVQCETLQQAERLCPWANAIQRHDGGFMCFEYRQDWLKWLRETFPEDWQE